MAVRRVGVFPDNRERGVYALTTSGLLGRQAFPGHDVVRSGELPWVRWSGFGVPLGLRCALFSGLEAV